MEAEVLIVGEPGVRTPLARQAAALGYEVELVAPGGACERIAGGVLPRVVVVCLADVDPPDFMTSLRRVQRGAAVPVTLYGSLGGSLLDFADVLDLGADHFLEEPVADEQLASALEALGSLYLMVNRRADARAMYRRVLLLSPGHPAAKLVLEKLR